MFLASNQYIWMISEGSCDTEDWSNSALHHRNKIKYTIYKYFCDYVYVFLYIVWIFFYKLYNVLYFYKFLYSYYKLLKYIRTEMSSTVIFQNATAFTVFWSNKSSLD